MADYKISYIGDSQVGNVHHIGISHDGNYYSVIFGEYANGGFFSIPNWNVYSGSVVKTQIQSFYNELIYVVEEGEGCSPYAA